MSRAQVLVVDDECNMREMLDLGLSQFDFEGAINAIRSSVTE